MIQFDDRLQLASGDVVLVDVAIVRFVAVTIVIFLQVHEVLADIDIVEILKNARGVGGRLVVTIGDQLQRTLQRIARIQAQAIGAAVLRAAVVGVVTGVVLPRRNEIDLAIVGV